MKRLTVPLGVTLLTRAYSLSIWGPHQSKSQLAEAKIGLVPMTMMSPGSEADRARSLEKEVEGNWKMVPLPGVLKAPPFLRQTRLAHRFPRRPIMWVGIQKAVVALVREVPMQARTARSHKSPISARQ